MPKRKAAEAAVVPKGRGGGGRGAGRKPSAVNTKGADAADAPKRKQATLKGWSLAELIGVRKQQKTAGNGDWRSSCAAAGCAAAGRDRMVVLRGRTDGVRPTVRRSHRYVGTVPDGNNQTLRLTEKSKRLKYHFQIPIPIPPKFNQKKLKYRYDTGKWKTLNQLEISAPTTCSTTVGSHVLV